MQHIVLAAGAAVLVSAAAAPSVAAATPIWGPEAHLRLAASPDQYAPGELIVGFRGAASRAQVGRAHARVGARVTTRFPAFRMQLVKLPRGLSVAAAAHRYEADPAVKFAEPNYFRYPTVTPSDALFPQLWSLNNTGQLHLVSDFNLDGSAKSRAGTSNADINAPEAWDAHALQPHEDPNPIIAVIDTGVDLTHPDFVGQLWTNPGESCPGCETDGLDNDHNDKTDDVNGWDFSGAGDNGLLSPNEFVGYDHGTHVAGTIAAALDGTTGVVGVCPDCRIMVLKIARDSDGRLLTSAEIKALSYAKNHGAKIVNMSFGGPEWSNAEREAIRKSGLLAVVAAGNDSLDNDMALAKDVNGDGQLDTFSPFYPASYTLRNILAVGASNHKDENGYSTECNTTLDRSKPKCAFTNWGHDSVDLSAPGVDITSTVPGGDWQTWDGTSMAAPIVAGVAGLLRSEHSGYTVVQLKNAVMHSVNKPTTLKTMYVKPARGLTPRSGKVWTGSFTRTAGRVNALKALTAGTTNATPLTDGNINGARSMSRARVSGSVAYPADVNDVRKRKLHAGRRYRITLAVPRRKDYDLFVWKPGAKEIWQFPKLYRWSAHPGSTDEVVKFKVRRTGVFYLQVSAWLFKSGRYTLKIARVS